MISVVPPSLLDHVWQSTLFVFAVWLATWMFRQNAARVRCWLWTAASAKFLVPLSIFVGVGERFHWRAAPEAMQPTVSFVMGPVLAPSSSGLLPVTLGAQEFSVWPWLLTAAWALGTTIVLVSWWRQWLPIRAAVRHATPLTLDQQCDSTGLVVLSSSVMPEPGVVGFWRPRLVLPERTVERLTPAQLRTVIVHERCHIRCRDNLWAALHMAVEAIFWWHPAVWWIERRLLAERERACDEAVLQDGTLPRDYAEAILAVCRQAVGVRLACVTGVGGSHLRVRVEAIMRNEIGRPMARGRQLALASAVVASIGGPVIGGALAAQSALDVAPSAFTFEVASVKRNQSGAPRLLGMGLLPGARFSAANASLRELITSAYGTNGHTLQAARIVGGPAWINSDRFDVEARAEGENRRQMFLALRTLLTERFKLSVHTEVRQVPVYAIVLARGDGSFGPQLRRAEFDCAELARSGQPLVSGTESRGAPACALQMGPGLLKGRGATITEIVFGLSTLVDRVVVDRTGVEGSFDFDLTWASSYVPPPVGSLPDQPLPIAPQEADQSIFTALREQLGLRLEPQRAPVDVLVIDSAEPPTPN
jgi:bla regulator protein BlaR1